mgnify:CR=1 FL=1|jgi:lysozyme
MRGRNIPWGAWALAIAFLSAAIGWWSVHWRPGLTDYPVQGVDVSDAQGEIAWPTVEAAGADFAYIKATEGADISDPRFTENWEGAEKAGMRRGAYHFFSLCRNAAEQATNFISIVPRGGDSLPAAIDLEFSGNCKDRPARAAVLRELKIFIEMAEAHTGKPLVVQVARDFDDYYMISDAIDRPLWLKRFLLPPSYGAREWAMWQASTFRRVNGIEAPVHWNVIHP